ncbi:MAG: hypothetical protein HFF09_00670 [Oscillospiraceae bacterium]|nr:hypothetical protein [Oscillospiraceae bacterium]
MKFIFGEGFEALLYRYAARGMIGFVWDGTLGAIGAFIISLIIVILAVVGLITIIKRLLFGRKKSNSKYKYFKD